MSPALGTKQLLVRDFGRSAQKYDAASDLQFASAQKLVACLENYDGFTSVLDIGCGTGRVTELLSPLLYKDGNLVGADIALGMLEYFSGNHACNAQSSASGHLVCADAESLPFASESFDLLFSNFALQWCESLGQVIHDCSALLTAGGFFVAGIPVKGSLYELDEAWKKVDAGSHVHDFHTGNEVEQFFNDSGFDLEVSREELLVHYYEKPQQVLMNLKSIGASNKRPDRSRGLMGRDRLKAFYEVFEEFRNEQGYPLSYKVLLVVARKRDV